MSLTGVALALIVTIALACDNSQKCQSSSDCCDGHTCFEKNEWWSGCKPSCDPNWVDPYDNLKWSCKPLGGNPGNGGDGGNGGNGGSCGAFKEGFDVVGDNLAEIPVSSAQQCCDICSAMPDCNAASLWNNICFPKAGSETVAKDGVTAIVKSGNGNGGNGNAGSCGAFKEGFDVVGDNLAEKPVGSAQECCDLCNSMPNCQAAALWNNICFPKASAETVAKDGVTAIVKSGNGNNNGNGGSCGVVREGFDVEGDNLAEQPVGSAQECCDLCKSLPNCQAAALWNNICFPKASTSLIAKNGVTAIVKSGSGNVNNGNGNGNGNSGGSGDLFCPTGNDMNLEYGSVSFKNGGWEMTGSARVSSKTAWNLLGGYMEWDMDLSRVADEVNTNFYTSSPSRPNCGANCYCDIQAGSFVSCMELDFLENNGKCVGNTALHMFPTDGRAGNANCDRWGCNSVMAKYSNPANLHFRAEVGNDGYVKVFVNGAPNTNYGPQPSGEANNVVVRTMQTIGAVIESSQWFGWVPAENICPRGNAGALGGSFVRVMNVKVKGKVVQGPIPNKC